VEVIRILLVEDHRDTAEVLSRLLQEDRYRVTVAGTLEEAKRLCDRQPFDLMICDLELPDGNGVDLLRHARRTCDVAGIVLSAHGDEGHKQAARAAGFRDYIVKPAPFEKIREAILRVTTSRPMAPDATAGGESTPV
jgi:two-component system CheB/CheR fusion protein